MRFIVLVCVLLLLVGCVGKRGCKLECEDCTRLEFECSGAIASDGGLTN